MSAAKVPVTPKLAPAARAKAQAILDAAARRLLAEKQRER